MICKDLFEVVTSSSSYIVIPMNEVVTIGACTAVGVHIDIFEATILRFLHGPDYTAPSTVLYEHRYFLVTNKELIEDPSSRSDTLRWIAHIIAIEGADVPWVKNPRKLITKASLTFAAKFLWAIVCDHLRPTINDNTLHPSQASLVACIMSRYALNVGRLLATEIRD